jgi:hypothetical protein
MQYSSIAFSLLDCLARGPVLVEENSTPMRGPSPHKNANETQDTEKSPASRS